MKFNKKRAFLALIVILLDIALLEGILGLSALASPRVNELLASPWTAGRVLPTVPDERLGHRPNPAKPGNDRKGFRNPEVPEKADIIALGDSQTYGTGVEPNEAWPRQLESLTDKKVYSMAYGGYGPAHSLILMDEALALQPSVVIEAFYSGNDLFDSFNVVYNKGQLPHLKSSDSQVQEKVREAEHAEPIGRRVSQMFQMGATPGARDGLSLRRLVSDYSRIYGVVRRVLYETTRQADNASEAIRDNWKLAKAFAESHPAYCQVFEDGRFKTVFTSEYRLSALDLEDPRIAEGLQIALRAIRAMHELAAARNIRFLVVLIPTKETVFHELWQTPSASYRKLTENEERFRKITREFFERAGIEHLDSLPALQEQLAAGIQPFFVSHDGHLNERGQQAIAKLVAAHLKSRKTLPAELREGAATRRHSDR
jgi:lysophospholipase L1-like esterase